MLYEYNLKEYLETDYRCPECGAMMTSGIQEPRGDYDEWLVEPHCFECDFETYGGKEPFSECVPVHGMKAVSYVRMEYKGGKRALLCQYSKLENNHSPASWGFGGRMYKDATFTPSYDFKVEYESGETEREFLARAKKLADAHIAS